MKLLKKNLIVYLLIFNTALFAQSISTHKERKWYRPTGISAEYAGGFGMISAGGIFTPTKKTELAITGGYTPVHYGEIWTVNTLLSYSPSRIRINRYLELSPLNIGIYSSISVGRNIYLKWPKKYVDHYYWWNSSVRYGPFVETNLKYTFKSNHSLALFFQCLTNDLYLFSYIPNTRTLFFSDILVLGTGIKYGF